MDLKYKCSKISRLRRFFPNGHFWRKSLLPGNDKWGINQRNGDGGPDWPESMGDVMRWSKKDPQHDEKLLTCSGRLTFPPRECDFWDLPQYHSFSVHEKIRLTKQNQRSFNVQRPRNSDFTRISRARSGNRKWFCIDFRSSKRNMMSLHVEGSFVKHFCFLVGFSPEPKMNVGDAKIAKRGRDWCAQLWRSYAWY